MFFFMSAQDGLIRRRYPSSGLKKSAYDEALDIAFFQCPAPPRRIRSDGYRRRLNPSYVLDGALTPGKPLAGCARRCSSQARITSRRDVLAAQCLGWSKARPSQAEAPPVPAHPGTRASMNNTARSYSLHGCVLIRRISACHAGWALAMVVICPGATPCWRRNVLAAIALSYQR